MSSSKDPSRGMWNTFGFLTKVKYGGALGKIAAVGIVFFLLLCVVTFAAHGVTAILWGVLAVALVALLFLVLRMEAIFKSNPEMATLEGKEVLQYRQLESKTKDHAPVPEIEITIDPELMVTNQTSMLDAADDSEGE